MARSTRIALLIVGTLAGCGAPGPYVAQEPPLLALRSDPYVVPPAPEPEGAPSTVDARRRLEAEWPPVDALSLPQPLPPEGPLPVRPRLGRGRPPITRDTPFRAPISVHGLPHVDGVILRAAPSPASGGRVVLILETR